MTTLTDKNLGVREHKKPGFTIMMEKENRNYIGASRKISDHSLTNFFF